MGTRPTRVSLRSWRSCCPTPQTASNGSDGAQRGLADTSLFIALETARPLAGTLPASLAVSVVTVGELSLGVLAAGDDDRSRRLDTLTRALRLEPLPVDEAVAAAWARLRLRLRDAGIRMPLNDSWIAATAVVYDLPVVTQDADFDGVPGLDVIRV